MGEALGVLVLLALAGSAVVWRVGKSWDKTDLRPSEGDRVVRWLPWRRS